MLLVGRQDRHQIHKKFHSNNPRFLFGMWRAWNSQKVDSKAKVESINTKSSVFIIVYYAEAEQYTAAIKQTKNTIYRLGLQNRNFSAITCSINKMSPHARLDSVQTTIQRWNVVLDRIIPTSFLFILAKVAIITISEFRAIFQNKMIL